MKPRSPLRRALFSPAARRGWLVALAVLVVAVLVLALSPDDVPLPSSGWDKLDHAAAFAALATCGMFAFRGRHAVAIRTTLGLLALGGAIELAQTQVPGRSADWHDLAADAVGIALGLFAASVTVRHLERRATPRDNDE
jgi:VanZ family protein